MTMFWLYGVLSDNLDQSVRRGSDGPPETHGMAHDRYDLHDLKSDESTHSAVFSGSERHQVYEAPVLQRSSGRGKTVRRFVTATTRLPLETGGNESTLVCERGTASFLCYRVVHMV